MSDPNQDPFDSLGFGIVAYLRMIKNMMLMFFIFSLLIIPAVYLYASKDGLKGLNNYSKAQFSLGNFGFSKDMCFSMFLDVGPPISFSCPEGAKMTSVNEFGLIPGDYDRKAYCGKSTDDAKVSQCDKYLKRTDFSADFTRLCQGQEACTQSLQL